MTNHYNKEGNENKMIIKGHKVACINFGEWGFPYIWSFTSIIVHKVESSASVSDILVVVGDVWVQKVVPPNTYTSHKHKIQFRVNHTNILPKHEFEFCC